MDFIIGLMPIELYIGVAIAICSILIYGIVDMHKKKPGNPMSGWLIVLIITIIISILYKCANELTTNVIFQKITDILSTIAIIITFVSLIIAFISAYKKGYIDKEKSKNLFPIIICCGIVIICCGISIYFLNR